MERKLGHSMHLDLRDALIAIRVAREVSHPATRHPAPPRIELLRRSYRRFALLQRVYITLPDSGEVGPVFGRRGLLSRFGKGDEVEGGNTDGRLRLHVVPPLFQVRR